MSAAATVASFAPTAAITATSTLSATHSVVASGGAAIESLLTSALPGVIASFLPSGVTTTTPLTASVITVPAAFEFSATLAGALAGGLAAVRAEFDAVGVTTIAVVSGLGGGILRDVLLQDQGIYALQRPTLLLATIFGAIVAFYFASAARKAQRTMYLIDSVSLGLFAVAGCDKALHSGLTFIPVVMLGTITAVGGGVIRDILMDKVPHVLRPGTLYAAAAILGSALYVLLVGWLNIVKPIALVAVVALVLLLRTIATARDWRAPTPVDLTPAVTRIPKHAVRWIRRTPSDRFPNSERDQADHRAGDGES